MIEFQNVSVTYPGRITALDGVSLTIQPGEFVFLVGPSGSGKSTLLKLLIRACLATSGRVVVNGRDVAAIPPGMVHQLRRQIGFVPQDIGLLSDKKVWENMAYAMRATGHSKREVRERIPEVMDRFGILERANAYPRQLSGGEQQRVAIARAVLNAPRLFLADEPTGHLDPETSKDIVGVLEQINARGATVVMATHDMPTVINLQRRVVRLESGKVVSDTMGLPGSD
ncbi:MAG: ATP-binding cassette domain-containing protein [Fimbriimonadales bacterium]